MVRADLIRALREENSDLTARETEKIVAVFLDQITDRLAAGGRVEIRGFGSFTTREHRARVGRNPQSGEAVVLDARRIPYFRPAKDLRALVSRSESDA